MPIKYVDENTGKFLPGALENTGAPSRFGITTPEQLVATSLSEENKKFVHPAFIVPPRAKL